MTRALIVEDEPLLAEQLRGKLAALWPGLVIAGVAGEGREALRLARQSRPDIAFLDIRLPGMSGLEVAAALPVDTRVVFVTAHDEFAVDAFRAAAVDYLLKPVSDERLRATIERLRDGESRRDASRQREELLSLLQRLGAGASPEYLQWIRAGLGETTVLVPVDDVAYFRAEAKYTSAFTRDREHLLRRPISRLEQQLDPNRFWRVHRGIIVRVEQIISASRDLRGRYTLTLRDRPEKLRSSQAYGHLFRLM